MADINNQRTTRLLSTQDSTVVSDATQSTNQQSANRAVCEVCGRCMPVTKAGLLRVHGPLSNRCEGSGMSPTLPSPSMVTTQDTTVASSGLPPADSQRPASFPSDSLLTLFRRSSTSAKILKRIPRASRHLAASKLASILNDVTQRNDADSWDRLFRFSFRCLRVPRRGGRRRSLAASVNQQLRDEVDPSPQAKGHRPISRPAQDPLANLAKRVSSKLEEGDYKGAVRLFCSDDTIADINHETISALQTKHPKAHPDTSFPPPPEPSVVPGPLSDEEVIKAIRSFPCGSAGGPDGLRPQHLKDLTSESAERGGKELLQSLSMFILHVLEGNTPAFVQSVLFGANLVTLRKKEGGIRPIAVGQSLRRLVAKCAAFRVVESMGATFSPLQLGYGVPLGCEAAAHAARQYLRHMDTGQVMVKLDFRNAFNCLRRDKILTAVKKAAPELFHLVSSAYQRPSSLFCGEHILQSEEGIQQGDPLGPLLFCLTTHPLVTSLQSEFRVFYLDDGTLGGSLQTVLHDLDLVKEKAAELGLELNLSKSELVCDDESTCEAFLSQAPGIRRVSCGKASLLGTPLGSVDSISGTIKEKADILRRMGERLNLLPSQDALLLLRHSFAIPKVLYILRTAPCFLSSELMSYDDLLRSILSDVINVTLDDNLAFLQASLPVRDGGLGIRRTVQLAPSAFLASAAGCSDLIRQIVPSRIHNISDPHVEMALHLWSEDHNNPPPSMPAASSQRVWDSAKVQAAHTILLETAPSPECRARLLAVSCPESGAWLNALPISSVGLKMDDEVVRIAVGLRLGLPLCRSHVCSSCGGEINQRGTHGLSCRFSKGRHSRHAALNDIVKRALDSAKIPSHLEPSGLFRSDGKRPDGATVVPWRCGRILVWDATCSDTLAPSHQTLAAREARAVAMEAEQRKCTKYVHLESSHIFIPIAVETLGALGPQAQSFFKEVARRVKSVTNEPRSHEFLIQRVAVAIQRGNAASVLGATVAG